MNILRTTCAAFGLALASACGSVELPDTHDYRLAPPDQTAAPAPARAGVLRVGAIELAGDLGGDRLLVADGPVRVSAFRNHRWAGPLDRLVADVVITGLRRSGSFAHVKAETDRGDADWLLTGRVLDFHQAWRDGHWCGLVTLDLHLAGARGEPLFGAEFQAATPLDGDDPEALVLALSRSVGSIVERLGAACVAATPPR